MSAVILFFPGAPSRPLSGPANPLSLGWCQAHAPLVDAALDLLHADDREFERRMTLMTDPEGRSMLDELRDQLEKAGAHVGDLADAMALAAERIRDGLARLMVAPAPAG